jgi:hypothetical protein
MANESIEEGDSTERAKAIIEVAPVHDAGSNRGLPRDSTGEGTAPEQSKGSRRRWWCFWRWRVWRFWQWRFWWKDAPSAQLAKKDIAAALALHSPGLVAEVHAISLRALQAEEQRESRLDAKAQSLLTAASLTLTVAFTFGGSVLLGHPEYLRSGGTLVAVACLGGYGLALVMGLLASIHAVSALRVSNEYRHVAESDVFNRQELLEADAACTEPAAKSDNEKAVALYQRYMASAYWRIWQQHYALHERKADKIRKGQRALLGFLAMLLLIAGALAYTATDLYIEFRKAHP